MQHSTDYPHKLRQGLAELRAAPPVRALFRDVDRVQPAWLFADTQLLGDVLIEGLKTLDGTPEARWFERGLRSSWVEHRQQIATRADTLEVLAAGGYPQGLPDAEAEFDRRLAEARTIVEVFR